MTITMFLYTAIKYPVVPVVAQIKSSSRFFHLAPKNYLRGRPKYSSYEVEAEELENDVHPLPPNPNCNVNFYGIESDEGVIIIDQNPVQQKENHVQQNSNSKVSKEKFYRASFGIIRQDSDNKVQFHGQYKSEFYSAFPHKSTEFSEVCGNSRQIERTLVGATCSVSDCSKMKPNDKEHPLAEQYPTLNLDLESPHNEDKIQGNDKSNPHENTNYTVNYIDQYYFGNTVEKDSNSDKDVNVSCGIEEKSNFFYQSNEDEIQRSNKSSSCEITNQTENYIDEYYFGNTVGKDKSGINNVSLAGGQKSNFFDENNEDKIQANDKSNLCQNSNQTVNYIDELIDEHFGNSIENKLGVNMNVSYAVEDKSNSDINHFGNITKDQSLYNNLNSVQSIKSKNEFLPKNKTVCKIHSHSDAYRNLSAVNDTKQLSSEINNSSPLEYTKPYVSQINTSFIENNTSVLGKYPKNANSSVNVVSFGSDHHKEQFTDNFKNVIPTKHLSQNLVPQHASQNPLPFLKCDALHRNVKYAEQTDKFNQISPKANISNITQISSKASISSCNTQLSSNNASSKISVNSHVIQTGDSISKALTEDAAINAHDFVTKLREKQETKTNTVQKGNLPSEEKLDSKGFRILKHQVPDLSLFTQDEILDILKSRILFSDENLLVLDKPYGLIMHDSQTTKLPCLSLYLDNLAREINPDEKDPKLFTVHRLDKETTGCLLLARNEITAQNLKSLFAQRKIIKKYWIVTSRVPSPLKGIIDIPISEGSVNKKNRMVLHPDIPKDIPYRNHSKSGVRAVTSYKVLCISGNAALIEVIPETGIKHQIRVHFGFGLSCPILGDHKYSHIDKLAPQTLSSDLLQRLHVRQSKVRYIPMHIHSHSVTIPGYLSERDLFVKAPLPSHMIANMKRLKFKKKNMLSL